MSKKAQRKIIITVTGDVTSPAPDALMGKSISIDLSGSRVVGYDANLKPGEKSHIHIGVHCESLVVSTVDDEPVVE